MPTYSNPAPSGQYMEALLSSGFIDDIDTFLTQLSLFCTFQNKILEEKNKNDFNLLTFEDLIDPTLFLPSSEHPNGITSTDYISSALYIYEKLCQLFMTVRKNDGKSSPSQNNNINTKSEKKSITKTLTEIFETKIWFDITLQLLIYLTQSIQFQSFLLLNSHEATGIDNIHIFSSFLNHKTHFKLQNSNKFLPPSILHLFQLIITFLEYFMIQLPVHWHCFMNVSYKLGVISPIWAFPHPKLMDPDTNPRIQLTLDQYQRYICSTLLSQPVMGHFPEVAEFLRGKIANETKNQDQKLPFFALLTLLLLPMGVYSSPELLYIQSLHQAHIMSSEEHLAILNAFESGSKNDKNDKNEKNEKNDKNCEKINNTFFTMSLANNIHKNNQSDHQADLFLQTPLITKGNSVKSVSSPQDNNFGEVKSEELQKICTFFSEQSEITKLSLDYTNNTNLTRLLTDIYQLDLAQQERYYNICQNRQKIDSDCFFIISRFLLLIFNFFQLFIQSKFHSLHSPNCPALISSIGYDGCHQGEPFDMYLMRINGVLTEDECWDNENDESDENDENFDKKSQKNQKNQNKVEKFQTKFGLSIDIFLNIFPALIALGYHEQFIIARPVKRILLLIQNMLYMNLIQQKKIDFFQNKFDDNILFNFENEKKIKKGLKLLKNIIIHTLSAIDFISAKLSSPIPLRQKPSLSILSTLDEYSTRSFLYSSDLDNSSNNSSNNSEQHFSPNHLSRFFSEHHSSPFFFPNTISRDWVCDTLESFSANPHFKYPIITPASSIYATQVQQVTLSKGMFGNSVCQNSSFFIYFDFSLQKTTTAKTDYTVVDLLSTQKAQDDVASYYSTPSYRGYTPILTGSAGDSQHQLQTNMDWKDVDHIGFLSFLMGILGQKNEKEIFGVKNEPTKMESRMRKILHSWVTNTDVISTSLTTTSIYSTPKPQPSSYNVYSTPGKNDSQSDSQRDLTNFSTPKMNYSSEVQIPTVLTLGTNDMRSIIDLLLTKISQQPLYLTQLSYPIRQHSPFMVSLEDVFGGQRNDLNNDLNNNHKISFSNSSVSSDGSNQYSQHTIWNGNWSGVFSVDGDDVQGSNNNNNNNNNNNSSQENEKNIEKSTPPTTILSLDILTSLQFITSLTFLPLLDKNILYGNCLVDKSDQNDQNILPILQNKIKKDKDEKKITGEPLLFLFMGLMYSSDVTDYYNSINNNNNERFDLDSNQDNCLDSSQIDQCLPSLVPFLSFLPPSYHLILLIALIRTVLIWKEWDMYRYDDIVEVLMDCIESLRRQKLNVGELIVENKNNFGKEVGIFGAEDENQNELINQQNDGLGGYIQWSNVDEGLLDIVFNILGQFVILIDEKANPQF
jgi:hypothetical protein